MNVLAYIVNFIAVSIPGRVDGEVAREMAAQKEKNNEMTSKTAKNKKDDAAKAMTPARGRTLVAPAGWAFAIWGPIFAGELVFVIAQFFAKEGSSLSKTIKAVSNPFVLAQIYQTLWCASFRPKYKGGLMSISAGMLGGIAYSMSKAHNVFTSSRDSYTVIEYLIHFFPMALHFGWTTAATLVNLNGAVAVMNTASNKAVAIVGHVSVFAATCLGIAVSVTRTAPVYGGVISWALFAVADGMRQRLEAIGDKDKDARSSAQFQLHLSKAGAYVNAAVSVVVQLLFWNSKSKFDVAP